ncbi:MAG: alpha/beta fold hydrolase [Acidobacteriota bacterium]
MKLTAILCVFLLIAACGGTATNNNGVATDKVGGSPSPPAASPETGLMTITFAAPDGAKLVGSLYEASKQNSPALLLLHQWQSDRHSYDDFAKRMQAKGFAVLSIDGRGFGESTKKADGSAVIAGRTDADVKAMLGDTGAAIEFLSKQKNVDPSHVGIIGASYGSSLALIYAADNPKVAAVALLSPGLNYFGNMPDDPAIKKYGDRPLYMTAARDDQESAAAVDKLISAVKNSKYIAKVHEQGGHGTALFAVGLADDLDAFFSDRFGVSVK